MAHDGREERSQRYEFDPEREAAAQAARVEHHRHRHIDDPGVAEACRRHGGFDFPASIGGMLAALATLAILSGVLGSILGGLAIDEGLSATRELTVGALIASVVVLFLAFLVGGWVAGRMARYDGGKNGLMTAVWGLVLAALFTGIGAWVGAEFDLADRLNLPRWFSSDWVAGAVIAGVLGIAAMLFGGWLGGRIGERWHRRPDEVIARPRRGGLIERDTYSEERPTDRVVRDHTEGDVVHHISARRDEDTNER
jgi:hypothetical protein